jgi:putative MATE family efflux protein
MRKGGVNLVEGSVGGHLINLGTFMALGVISMTAMSIVDVYFVARLGHHQIAALTFTFPVLLIVTAVNIGLGNGAVAVIARAVGRGDREHIRTLSTDALILGVLLMGGMSLIGQLTITPMFTLMGADPEVMPYIQQYIHIWYLSSAVQTIPVVSASIMRALGDARSPSIMYATMSCTLIGLDPLLIFGWGPVPGFGVEGAAFANAVARTIAAIFSLSLLHFRFRALAPITLTWTRLKESWGKLLYVGLPAMMAQLAAPVSAALVTKIVAMSGITAVAAFGIASRIEGGASIYLWGIAGALPAFVGQNAGAGRMDRVEHAVKLAVRFCIAAGVCLFLAALAGGSAVVSHFSENAEVRNLAAFYLRVVALGYGLTGMVLIASQTMNALHRPLPAASISLARTVGVTIPFALIGHHFGQIHGVFIAIALSGAICGAAAWLTMTTIVAHEVRRAAA